MNAARRRIAVVLDGPPAPAWQRRALENLAESPVLELAEVVLLGAQRRRVLWRERDAIERHLLKLGEDAMELGPVAATTDTARGPAGPGGELVVWLSERPPPAGEPREVLALCHGGFSEPADAAFSRAVLQRRSSLQSDLLLIRGADAVVVERTVSEVRAFSVTLSRDMALWKLAPAIRRAAERAPGLSLPAQLPAPAPAGPSGAALLARASATWARVLTARLLFRRPWQVRVRVRAGELRVPVGWKGGSELVRWRPGHLYADPFLFEHEGRHHLFCEEVVGPGEPGIISHTELRPDGASADPPAPVLQASHHLSYPFVFAHEGELFMVPESRAAGRVELYRAEDFPRGWRREAILLEDLDAVDSTIVAEAGRLWLFAGVAAPGASSLDELHLFSAPAPRGPWVAHPRNPIVSDVRGARPAGAIQRWGGRLVRPAQDCSRRYGGAVSFREIDVLSTSDYAEHEIARIDPGDAGARATHTYAADGRFEAIDVRRRELRLRRAGGRRGASGAR